MSEPTIRYTNTNTGTPRPQPRRQGLSDRCWTCWMLGLLMLVLVFVTVANTIMLWDMSQHVKVVKVEQVVP